MNLTRYIEEAVLPGSLPRPLWLLKKVVGLPNYVISELSGISPTMLSRYCRGLTPGDHHVSLLREAVEEVLEELDLIDHPDKNVRDYVQELRRVSDEAINE